MRFMIFIVALAFASTSLAMHGAIPILQDFAPLQPAICYFNKKGEMLKGGEVAKPCVIGVALSTSKIYAVIHSKDMSEVIEVLEMDFNTGKNISVWKKGVRI